MYVCLLVTSCSVLQLSLSQFLICNMEVGATLKNDQRK